MWFLEKDHLYASKTGSSMARAKGINITISISFYSLTSTDFSSWCTQWDSRGQGGLVDKIHVCQACETRKDYEGQGADLREQTMDIQNVWNSYLPDNSLCLYVKLSCNMHPKYVKYKNNQAVKIVTGLVSCIIVSPEVWTCYMHCHIFWIGTFELWRIKEKSLSFFFHLPSYSVLH